MNLKRDGIPKPSCLLKAFPFVAIHLTSAGRGTESIAWKDYVQLQLNQVHTPTWRLVSGITKIAHLHPTVQIQTLPYHRDANIKHSEGFIHFSLPLHLVKPLEMKTKNVNPSSHERQNWNSPNSPRKKVYFWQGRIALRHKAEEGNFLPAHNIF